MAELDEQLIAAAQDGDVEALTALVADSHPTVRRFAYSLCATPEDAEDAAQEALIILYRKVGMLRATGALASWMFQVVRRECLRLARAMLRNQPVIGRQTREPDDGVGRGVGHEAALPAEDEVLRRLEASAVATAVAALPADQRRVLVLRDIQGYSGRMVADALGLSVAAMKSRLHRARATVRQTLEEHP